MTACCRAPRTPLVLSWLSRLKARNKLQLKGKGPNSQGTVHARGNPAINYVPLAVEIFVAVEGIDGIGEIDGLRKLGNA